MVTADLFLIEYLQEYFAFILSKKHHQHLIHILVKYETSFLITLIKMKTILSATVALLLLDQGQAINRSKIVQNDGPSNI